MLLGTCHGCCALPCWLCFRLVGGRQVDPTRCYWLPSGSSTHVKLGHSKETDLVDVPTARFWPVCRRLVQGKEKGATIEVDGERVALGIPQASSDMGLTQNRTSRVQRWYLLMACVSAVRCLASTAGSAA